MIMIDGVAISKNIQENIRPRVEGKKVLVLLPPGTEETSYMTQKMKIAHTLGVVMEEIRVGSAEEALEVLRKKQDKANGVLIQLPFPDASWNIVLEEIDPKKDIDVLGPVSRARLLEGTNEILPPIVRAIDEILRSQGIEALHREWLVIGGGMLVGQPVSLSLLARKITFTVLEKNIHRSDHLISRADIIIVGTGTPHGIDLSNASPAAFVIDAGATMTSSGIRGDVDPSTIQHVSWFSPVPGGLGPMTVTCLFSNLA